MRFTNETQNKVLYKVHLEVTFQYDFEKGFQCINAEKPALTYLPNPRIPKVKLKNHHVRRLVFSEEVPTAKKLPENVILGAADIQRIKSPEPGRNPDTGPGAEFAMLGWVTPGRSISPNAEAEKGFYLDFGRRICANVFLGNTRISG